jgi:CheY-like chemotaxis protein
VRLATELHPQVIVLDIMMPDRDGWELLQEV